MLFMLVWRLIGTYDVLKIILSNFRGNAAYLPIRYAFYNWKVRLKNNNKNLLEVSKIDSNELGNFATKKRTPKWNSICMCYNMLPTKK